MTTDELLAILPPDEDNRWELKSANILASKGELKKELGKQMSAFANSGGGCLVIGFADKTRQVQACEEKIGRQSMKDFLSTMVEQSVEYPLQSYSVHRIPFTSEPTHSVFVIEVGDSPAAPHQAKDERQYYWRIDGHSKPAPHFHVELLRSRTTKAVLSIQIVKYEVSIVSGITRDVCLLLSPTIKNNSMHSTEAWGVLLKTVDVQESWHHVETRQRLSSGVCIKCGSEYLLPHETKHVGLNIRSSVQPSGHSFSERLYECLEVYRNFQADIFPVSHNAVGQPFRFHWDELPGGWETAQQKFHAAYPKRL